MSENNISRRDLLKMMGAGAAIAATSGISPGWMRMARAQAKYPPGKVTLWSWGTPQLQTDWMNDFLKAKYQNAGLTGEAVGQSGAAEIQKQLLVNYAAGGSDLPDFVQGEAYQVNVYAKAGLLTDLTDWAAKLKDKMPNGIFDLWTINNKVWAFPWRPNTWMMYYNREAFAQAGISPDNIKTWKDWSEAGKEIKKASKGETLLEYRDGGSYWHTAQQMIPQAGGRLIDNNGKVVVDTDPATVEVFMYLEQQYRDGLLYKTTSWNPGWYQAMRDKKFAAMHYGNWWDEFLKQNVPDMAGKWGLMPLPAFSNGRRKGAMESAWFSIINRPNAPYVGLIKEMLEWQYLDPQRVIEYMKTMTAKKLPAFLPVLKSTYSDPFLTQPDPYYGDQSFQAAAAATTVDAPTVLDPTLDGSGNIASVIDTELAKVYNDEQDMTAALKNMKVGIERILPDILEARKW